MLLCTELGLAAVATVAVVVGELQFDFEAHIQHCLVAAVQGELFGAEVEGGLVSEPGQPCTGRPL